MSPGCRSLLPCSEARVRNLVLCALIHAIRCSLHLYFMHNVARTEGDGEGRDVGDSLKPSEGEKTWMSRQPATSVTMRGA